MIVVRKLLDFFFTQRELKILDDVMPESTKRKQAEEERKKAEMERHDVSQHDVPLMSKSFGVEFHFSYFLNIVVIHFEAISGKRYRYHHLFCANTNQFTSFSVLSIVVQISFLVLVFTGHVFFSNFTEFLR